MKRRQDSSSGSCMNTLKKAKYSTGANHFDQVASIASKSDESISLVQKELREGKFGSVAKDIEAIFSKRLLNPKPLPENVEDLESVNVGSNTPMSKLKVVSVDLESDEEERGDLSRNVALNRVISPENKEVIEHVDNKNWEEKIDKCAEINPKVDDKRDIGEVGKSLYNKPRGVNEDENVDFEIFAQSKLIWEQMMKKLAGGAKKSSKSILDDVIDLENESVRNDNPTSKLKVEIIIDSDSDEQEKDNDGQASALSQNAVLNRCHKETSMKNEEIEEHTNSQTWVEETSNVCTEIHPEAIEEENILENVESQARVEETIICTETPPEDEEVIELESHATSSEDATLASGIETEIEKAKEKEKKRDKGVYVGVQKDEDSNQISNQDDSLDDLWNEMLMGQELSKDSSHPSPKKEVSEKKEVCEHSFILKDDLGQVCRICGLIGRKIETIFEFQYYKKKSTRTYIRSRNSTETDSIMMDRDDTAPDEIHAHPRHKKHMKPHQREGFEFLTRNLLGRDPGGCILAHAPGSGKTFTIICFLQSFLAKQPDSRPLVVLPKGIMSTWKKEFWKWQVEDLPLYDTAKKENRGQQLEVLKLWVENRSVLFLSYQQFSCIVCDPDDSAASKSCREILLTFPSVLVLDEGHTPRNDGTDIFQALSMVKTPRKVVLSGTLYQNHVKEVFNVLNLVRPNFLKSETSHAIVTRLKSKVAMPGNFHEAVENELNRDGDFRRKVSVINDLRELTREVLHYYKGDFSGDLPGMVDFAVLLNPSLKQKYEADKVTKTFPATATFKAKLVRSAIYLHPSLRSLHDGEVVTEDEIDEILKSSDPDEGVKAKFFLSILNLCEAKKEKLLVFGQYLNQLKFLERLAAREKGWSLGREIFAVSGKSKAEERERSVEQFNGSEHSRVFFGSIKACGEGISLVGASRIVIMDVHLNPSVTRQAIGRAFRPGQTKRVVAYRLVAADSPEVGDYETCTRKEMISKTWFEWREHCGYRDFEVEKVDVRDCGDEFLEANPRLQKDVKVLYRR